MDWKEIRQFMEGNKAHVGLGDFTFEIPKKKFYLGGDLAQAFTEVLEKTIELQISVEFFEKPEKEQRSILRHELIHCRHQVYQQTIEKITEHVEEVYINDLTKGTENIK